MAQNAQALPVGLEAEQHHPTEMVYIKIALILAVITLVEVVIYYVEKVGSILVPALILLSAVKFVTVVGYFMHLKFDDKRLTYVFVSGFGLAAGIYIGMVTLHHFHEVVTFVSNMI